MKKKWTVEAVLIVLLVILAYWGYRQQDTYHLIRSIIKNNPYCEAFQVNEDGSKTEYTVEIDDLGWGVWKEIEKLSFVHQGDKIEYRITLNDYTKKADATPGEESGIIFIIEDNGEMIGEYEASYHFLKFKELKSIDTRNENGEGWTQYSRDPALFPEEGEDIFRLIEDDIQKRAQKCWY